MKRDWDVFPNKPLMLMITIAMVIFSVISLLLNKEHFYKMLFYGAGAITICISFLIVVACDNFFSTMSGQARREVSKMALTALVLFLLGCSFVAVAEFLL